MIQDGDVSLLGGEWPHCCEGCQPRPRTDDRLFVENQINRLGEIGFSLGKDVSLFLLYRKKIKILVTIQ